MLTGIAPTWHPQLSKPPKPQVAAMWFVRVSPFVLPVCALLATSCESAPAPTPGVMTPSSPITDRVSDGLLHNTDLQDVVAAQTARDVEQLDAFLNHRNPLVRARAAFGAGSVRSAALTPQLRRLLQDPDPRVRADAAFALGQSGDTSVAIALSAALEGETEVTAQSRIIEALGRVGTHESLMELASMDPSRAEAPAVALAITRLGARNIHDPAAVSWIADRLTAGSAQLRVNAAYYFARMPSSKPWALHAAFVRDALEDYGLDEPAAMHLVLGLGRFHGADGKLLIHRLENAVDWRVRANTAAALAPLSSDRRIIESLISSLDDANTHVAANAAASLDWSEILERDDLDRIEDWLTRHPGTSVVHGALLGVLANRERGQVVLEFANEIRTTNEPGLAAIVPAIGLVQSKDGLSLLGKLASSNDRQIRRAAISAVGNRWARWGAAVDGTTPFFDIMSDVLQTENDENVLPAASVLTDPAFLPEGSVDVLLSAYDHMIHDDTPPGIMAPLIRVLGTTEHDDIRRALEKTVRHPHPVVRQAAAHTLEGGTGAALGVDNTSMHPAPEIDWSALSRWGPNPQVRLETNQGDVIVELSTEQAPHTVQHFVEKVLAGQYDNTPFHRVLPNFAAQTGTTPPVESRPTRGYPVSEFTRIPFARGVLGMANSGKDTENTEFFIIHSMQPHLDGRYTAFGQVVHGMDVIDRITTQDVIVSASLIGNNISS